MESAKEIYCLLYIFVLCIKRLSHLISMAVSHNLWEPICLSRRDPKISHLCFADDLVLFTKASLEQLSVIKGILDIFCISSGQKVNLTKSCVFFSKNIHITTILELSSALGVRLTSNLGKYLGVPLFHDRCSRNHFQFIIDRMSSRLSS